MNSLDMQTAAVLRRELNTSRDDTHVPSQVIQWLEKRVAYYDDEERKVRAELPPP